jgi:hypothetical protein
MSEIQKKYVAMLRDVAQIVIGTLVREDDDVVVLTQPAIVHVGVSQEKSMNLQFIPLELVSIQPPISLRVLLDDSQSDADIEFTFKKAELLSYDIPLNAQIFSAYEGAINPSQIITPPNPGGLVGPDGNPLNDDTPKVQKLF